MEKLPTAKEMFEANPILPPGVTRNACIAFMKTFAKLHVEAALKAAYENIEYTEVDSSVPYVVEDSILNSYPSSNIK